MVGGVGDEAFWEFVQGDGDGGLEGEGEEDVGWDVVVVGCGMGGGMRGMGVRMGVRVSGDGGLGGD